MVPVDHEKKTRISDSGPVRDPFLGRAIDGYRIDELIGRGGMGEVYKATQLSLNRPVAIKVLPPEFAEDRRFLDRFEREVDILSRLSHPNIVTVFERGEVDGRPYLVMEYIAGTSLREVLRQGPLPTGEALLIVRAVLSALEHAHAQGIIHRDIKPENILLAPRGVVKVADFGLSRLIHGPEMTRLTQSLVALGTYEYMAPEQREQAKDSDERTDLYATGVVLYEAIAGELPIGHFDPLSKKRPGECDSRIDGVVEKSLKKEPAERYQEAEQMGDAVSRLITQPGVAPVPIEEAPESVVVPAPEPVVETVSVAESVRMENHIDNLAMIDRVFAALLGLAGAFWWSMGLFDQIDLKSDTTAAIWMGVGVLWLLGAYLCWYAGSLLKRRSPGAPGLQALLASVAGLTVVLLPFAMYSFWALWGHRGRAYYALRATGLSPAQAGREVHGLLGSARSAPPVREVGERDARRKVWIPALAVVVLLAVIASAGAGITPLAVVLVVLLVLMLLPFLWGFLAAGFALACVVGVVYMSAGGDSVEPSDPATSVPTFSGNAIYVAQVHTNTAFDDGVLQRVVRSPKATAWIKRVARPTWNYPEGVHTQIVRASSGDKILVRFTRKGVAPARERSNAEQRVAAALGVLFSTVFAEDVTQSFHYGAAEFLQALRSNPPPADLSDVRTVQLVRWRDPEKVHPHNAEEQILKSNIIQDWITRRAKPGWSFPDGIKLYRTRSGVSASVDRELTANGSVDWSGPELIALDSLADALAANMAKYVVKAVSFGGKEEPDVPEAPFWEPPVVIRDHGK